VLAGGNGTGKTTFYRTRLAALGLPFINVRIIGQRSHLRLWKRAIYNPIKKPAKIICESHPELCNAASRDFQAVLVKIGPDRVKTR
jgi:hypothetical protein